jgi:hypothetical protein
MGQKSIYINGMHYRLPNALAFTIRGMGKPIFAYYEVIAYRRPLKGEYYLSGAICGAWWASNDLCNSYLIVVPTFEVTTKTVHLEGDRIKL